MKCLVTGGRDKNGRFIRTRMEWSLGNFDDGYVDANGRMRVFRPGHHRASKLGYVLRSIVAYEAYNNDIVTREYNIHHIDHDRLNDSKENLEKLTQSQHSKEHNLERSLKAAIWFSCIICKKDFRLPKYRLKEKGRGKYCSQICYKKRGPK